MTSACNHWLITGGRPPSCSPPPAVAEPAPNPQCGRCSGPNASGNTSVIGNRPDGVSTTKDGPPNSYSTCRHRPHGISSSPAPDRQATATSRPPPVSRSCPTRVHSAHRPSPYEAFSTLQPVIVRPSSTSAAAPTCNP